MGVCRRVRAYLAVAPGVPSQSPPEQRQPARRVTAQSWRSRDMGW